MAAPIDCTHHNGPSDGLPNTVARTYVRSRANASRSKNHLSNSDDAIYVMNIDSTEQIRLTNRAGYDGDPAWIPIYQ